MQYFQIPNNVSITSLKTNGGTLKNGNYEDMVSVPVQEDTFLL